MDQRKRLSHVRQPGEKSVIAGGGDRDIVRVGKNKWLMYYGANLGGDEFGIKVARSTGKGKVVPR